MEGASFKALGARNELLGANIDSLTLIICFFRGFAPVGSLFLRLRRIAQRHQNVQFEMNKPYAEVESKEKSS